MPNLSDIRGKLAQVSEHSFDAKLLAGGQSLIPLLNFPRAGPAILIDLNRLEELDFVRLEADGALRIGAMTRQGTLERHPLIAAHAPLLAETVPFVAHPQIRNRGTIGGTLAHADLAELLARLLMHIPAPRLHLVRYYGHDSHVSRARRRQELAAASAAVAPAPVS